MDLCEVDARMTVRHPWERSRVKALRAILDRGGALSAPRRVLDVGCGDAYAAAGLFRNGEAAAIDGVDTHLTGEECRDLSSGRPRLSLHADYAGLTPGSYDLLLLLDVIEHVDDERGLLDRVLHFAAPGARLLLTAPAFDFLFSAHDRLLGHRRRYTRRGLGRLTADAGLDSLASGYLFGSLLIPRLLLVCLERLRGGRGMARGAASWRYGAAPARVMEALLDADAAVSLRFGGLGLSLPGLSVWQLCRKSS